MIPATLCRLAWNRMAPYRLVPDKSVPNSSAPCKLASHSRASRFPRRASVISSRASSSVILILGLILSPRSSPHSTPVRPHSVLFLQSFAGYPRGVLQKPRNCRRCTVGGQLKFAQATRIFLICVGPIKSQLRLDFNNILPSDRRQRNRQGRNDRANFA